MQIGQFARFMQNYTVRVSEFVRKTIGRFLRLLVLMSRGSQCQVTPQSNFSECYRRSYCAVIDDRRLRSAGASADLDFIISPEDAQLARRKRRIIVIGSVVLVLAILLDVFGRRPAGNAIGAWQARRHAQKAFAFIDKEQWTDARSEAMAAYQLSPGQPEALRAVARFLTRTHSIEALDFWKELSRKTSLTRVDVRDEAMIAIIAGDIALADTAVDELIDSHAEPADWLLAAQLAIQKNLPEEAESYLAKIVADSRATENEQFRATLLQLSLAANSPSERANALTRLGKLGEGKSATSLDALVVVAQNTLAAPVDSSDLTRNEAERLASALENHPLAKAKHKLLAFDLRMHADPTQREQLIARAIAASKDSDPADRLDLARWLNSKGEYQRVIDSIPLEKAVQSSDLFLQHLDALAGLGRWNEIKQLLQSGEFPLEPFLEDMYLARCNSQLGEQTASENDWQRSLEAAQGDARKLIALAQYAEQNNNTEIAEVAYNGAASAAPKLRMALASMVIQPDLNRMPSQGPGNSGGGGGSSIPDATNNIWGNAIPGAEPGGSGTVASTSGSSMLNFSQQTGGTLALIDGTFSNDATAANKTISASHGAGSGTNSGAGGSDAGSGINSGVGGGSAGQGSGNGTGSGGTTLTSERSSVTTTIGETPGGIQPFQVDANASWTGAISSIWSVPGNWTAGGPPNANEVASFDRAFANQPIITASTAVGELHMATGVAQNVTLSNSAAQILTIEGVGGTGVLIDNASAFTLTIDARIGLDASQAWTNNSGNLFTVSGATLSLGEDNLLTVNGTGNTLISSATDGAGGMGSAIIKDGSGTLTVTANNSYSGGTTVNGGTLLVNGRGDLGDGNVTVNNSGTLGGNTTSPIISFGVFGNGNAHLTVAAGGSLAPGNGGNNTAVITVNALTLEPASNFRIDINGTTPGIGYDRLVVTASGNNRFVITNSNLVVTVGTTLSVGQTFLIGVRAAAGPITGQFAQGNTVTGSDGTVFVISYAGGPDGNDIVLTVIQASPVPEPSTWMGGVLAIAGLAFTQRSKLRKLIAFSR